MFRKVMPLLVVLLFVLVASAVQMQQIPQPAPPPAFRTDDPRYVPGEVREFRGSIMIGKGGKKSRFATREITNGDPMMKTRAPYNDGRFYGDANLWLSGNWVWAGASSMLLIQQASKITVCANVTSFTVDGLTQGGASSCSQIKKANVWVTSPNYDRWSGCHILSTNSPLNRSASNYTSHSFGTFTGHASSSFWYKCSS